MIVRKIGQRTVIVLEPGEARDIHLIAHQQRDDNRLLLRLSDELEQALGE